MSQTPLIQLVTTGIKDEYLSLNPDISYFKYVYKRHTRFAIHSLKNEFNTKPLLSSEDQKCMINIQRHGDLLADINLVMTLPAIKSYKEDKGNVPGDLRFRWIENFGTLLVKEATIYIGSLGVPINKLYGEWILIWNELTLDTGKKEKYDKLTGNIEKNINPRVEETTIKLGKLNKLKYEYYKYANPNGDSPSINENKICIPLPFYFSKDSMLYLPLCALQLNEIKVEIEIENVEKLYEVFDIEYKKYISPIKYNERYSKNITIKDFVGENVDLKAYLETKYIFLDEVERKAIILNKTNNNFLVERVYRKDEIISSKSINIKLDINNPVKEIIWKLNRRERDENGLNYLDNDDEEIMKTAKILWQGVNERVEEKDNIFYGKIQPYYHHSAVPKEGIYCYSFALFPEKWRPSGYFNPSGRHEISTSLSLELNRTGNYDISIYVVMYNILEIIGGIGSFKFAI